MGYRYRERSKARPIILGILVVLWCIFWVGSAIYAYLTDVALTSDTSAWLERAQVASNIPDMQGYLINCKEGMEKWGLTQGYGDLLYKTAQCDYTLIMRALERSIERCEDIKGFSETSLEYQVALDDLRGQIRELDIYAPIGFWQGDIVHLLWAIWAWLGWIVVGLSIIRFLESL